MDRGSRGGPRRDNRSGGGGQRSFGGPREPREMHDATCAECKQPCQVPFVPSKDADGNDRPVYCRDCFMKRKKY